MRVISNRTDVSHWCLEHFLPPACEGKVLYTCQEGRGERMKGTLGCARFGFVCANSCAPDNAIGIAMEKFTLARYKTAKIYQNEHTRHKTILAFGPRRGKGGEG